MTLAPPFRPCAPAPAAVVPGRSGIPSLRPALLAFAAFAGSLHGAAPPNVLFIMIDDLRPELGCYGHPVVKSPAIDRLAREGTLFRRAYCQQALCAPSRASLLTGWRPDTTGITDLTHPVRKTIPDVRTLPQHFLANGYETMALGKIYHHPTDDNGIGWSTPAWEPPGAWAQAIDSANAATGPGGRTTTWECLDVPDAAYPDGKIAARAVAELGRFKSAGRPFFLAVGFLKPHLPFFAPKKYWDLYPPADITLPARQTWPDGMPPVAGSDWGELRQYRGIPHSGGLDEPVARTLIHGYYACVSYVDAMVGQVLAELDRQGLRENTVVVLCGDHGWKLDDYGAWCKHTNLEVDTHAPLIVAAPHQKTAGRESAALVEFVDLYPTLAELCGLQIPATCEGTSFAPLLDQPALPWKSAAFSQYPRGKNVMGYTLRDARWRYTEWIDGPTKTVVARELYDQASSDIAEINLVDDSTRTTEVARLSALLDRGQGWRKVRQVLTTSATKVAAP